MDLEILKNVLAIRETSSITKAAEKLFLSESVLSRQLARIEKELDVQLFTRSRSGLTITPAGKIIFDAMQDANVLLKEAVRKARAIQSGKRNVITIGLTQYHTLTSEACQFFSNFNMHYPELQLNFLSMESSHLHEQLLNGQVDFVYGATAAFEDDRFFVKPIESIDTCLIVSSLHPALLSPAENLTLSDFRDDSFLILEKQPEMVEVLNTIGLRAGFPMKICAVSDMCTMLTMIQFGNGVAVSARTNTFFSASRLTALPLKEFSRLDLGLIGKMENQKNSFPELVQAAELYSQNRTEQANR